ncbi:MAG: flagellar hook protein FlgE, partial [Sulfurimonas sp.]|nr:flagellar hook protein FlgE [Sulfurimonas sp.]
DLEGYAINKNAEIIATFTNGIQSIVGKIAIYHFQNDQGLERLNGTKFAQGSNSGEAIFYKDATGQNIIGSDIVNFKLEGSNIDITYGMTELIILQRSFDANSKSITTADEMMQKALNMDA